jgi:hypothetical protein
MCDATDRTPDDVAQRVLDLVMLEITRTRARYRRRYPDAYQCPETGERSLLAIGLGPTALSVRVRSHEHHHVHGDGHGPTVLVSIATNRTIKEVERIAVATDLYDAGLCARYAVGFGALLGVELARIGLEP